MRQTWTANWDFMTARTSVGSQRKLSRSGSPVGAMSATPVNLHIHSPRIHSWQGGLPMQPDW